MAFDPEQTTLIHEMLGIFQGATLDWYDYNDWTTGEVASVPIQQQVDFSKATTRITAILAAIVAGSTGREARIKEIIAKYDIISLELARIADGGAAGTPGLQYSTEAHKRSLMRLLQTNLGIRVVVHNSPNFEGAGGRNIRVGR